MMKRGLVLALTLVCGSFASSAQAAPIIFYGADNAAGIGGAHPVSAAVAAAFDAAVTETLITFEGLPVGNFAALAVAPGVTATLSGQDPLFCSGICATNVDDLGFNTTAAGTNHVRLNPNFNSAGATLTFSFVNPINSFGAYFTATQVTFPGTIHATFNDGSAQDFIIAKNSGDAGGILFWGFTDFGASLTSISLSTGATNASRDLWGLDDVRFAPAEAAAVPEPTSMLLLGTGLLGVARSYRKRKAQL